MPVGEEVLFLQSTAWWIVGRMQAFQSVYQVEKAANRHTFSNARIAPGEIGKAGWGILALHVTVFSFVLFLVWHPHFPLSSPLLNPHVKVKENLFMIDLSKCYTSVSPSGGFVKLCDILYYTTWVIGLCHAPGGRRGGGVVLHYQQCKFYCRVCMTWGFRFSSWFCKVIHL